MRSHRVAALGFALVILYFMFRDGRSFGGGLVRVVRQTCGDAWSKRAADAKNASAGNSVPPAAMALLAQWWRAEASEWAEPGTSNESQT